MPVLSRKYLRLSGGSRLAYASAGDPSLPAVLLLHGLPSSADTFRDVVSELAQVAYLIVPDLPGFGASEPLAKTSFEGYGEAMFELLAALNVGPRYLYLHDFGAPAALHVAMNEPDAVLGLIVQNANAHRSGFSQQWDDVFAFWANPNAETTAAVTGHLTYEGTRDQYLAGVPPEFAAHISPQGWEEDWRVMSLPGRLDMQRELLADYGNYVARFDQISRYLIEQQPRALMVWGRHDVYFEIEETLSWMQELPRMESHILDGGHMLLETHAAPAAELFAKFIAGGTH